MANTIPEDFVYLLNAPTFVTLVTIMPNGQAQATPTWANSDGEYIWINTAEDRQKDRNLRRNPKVTLVAMDPKNSYRYIQIRGEVVERTYEGAVDHINQLANAYEGVDEYFGGWVPESLRAVQKRVIYKIKPQKVNIKEK